MNKNSDILFLCQYFPPEMGAPAARTFEHAKRWVKKGCRVSVVTAVPNHPTGRLYPGYKNIFPYQLENQNGILVYRCWTYLAANAGKIRRVFNYVVYMIGSILVSLRVPPPKLIVATSPQLLCAIAGWVAAKLRRVPFVLEVRDLWPESILAVKAMKDGFLIRILFRMAQVLYRQSDLIVVVTHSFKKILSQKGIPESKIAVIPNGVDLSLFQPRDFSPKDHRIPFQILYVGTLGMAHGLLLVLQAAERLGESTQFILVGEGAEKKNLINEKKRLGLTNVIFKDFLPREKVPELMSEADLCLVMLRKDKLFQTVIPSKMFEMMGMAKPILLGVQGESLEILEKSGGGVGFEPGNLEDFIRKIEFLKQNRQRLQEMGQKGRDFVEQNFNRDNFAQNYLEELKKVSILMEEKSESMREKLVS